MEILSSNLLSYIFQYLTIEEIFTKLTLSKKLISLLKNENFQQILLKPYYPQEILSKIQPKDYQTCLISLIDYKIREIPFWGVESNGGLADNSLRFWIGKTFMQTTSPQVALRKVENVYISGTLAFDQIGFRNALKDYAYNINQKFGIVIRQIFYHQNQVITKKKDVDVKKICIFDVFRSFQILFHYLDEIDIDDGFQSIHYLQNYAQTKHIEIMQMINNDTYFLQEQSHQIMENNIALVQNITINRKTDFLRLIQTVLIFTSQDQYISYEPNENFNYKTTQQLIIQIQDQKYKPCQTNIPQLQNFQGVEYDNSKQQEYLYCTFYPYGNRQPLVWITFINQQLEEITLKFNKSTQRLAKSVSMRILDVMHQEDPEYQDGGATFSFVSLKGQLYNEQNWNVVNSLPD